jgi:VanZ family protein
VPFTDETIQLFVAGRSGQISDVWLDCAGAAFGTVVFMAAGRILSRTGVKKRDKKL